MSGANDQKYEFEAYFQLFFRELKSIVEAEGAGEMSTESVAKLKALLVKFWGIKLQDASPAD
jgi:hypothetical protein